MAFSTLAIDLTAKVASFEEGMNKAVKSLDRVDKRAASMSKSIKTAFGALGASLTVGSITAYGKSIIDAADNLKDMSDRTGVAIKDLASLSAGAEKSGTSLESVAKGIQRLTLSVGQAQNGNKEMAQSLTDLGVNAKDPTERFYQLADAVAKSKDPTKTAADLAKVLGKSYADLLPYLKQGADELRASARASASFSQAMAELAPNADKFNDQLTDLKFNAAGAAAALLNALIPAMNNVLDNVEQAQRLGASGFGFLQLLGLGVNPTQDPSTQLKKVNNELRIAEKELQLMSGLDPFGDKQELEQKIAQYKKLRSLLQVQVVEALQAPPVSTKTIDTGAFDFSSVLKDKTKVPKLDEIDPFYKERTAALKAAADEIQKFIDEQQEAINDLDREMAQEGVAAAEAYASALASLLSDTDLAKTQALYEKIEILNKAFFDGIIGVEQFDQAIKNLTEGTKEAGKEMDTFAKTAAENIQNSFADFLFDPFADGLDGMLQGFGEMIRKMIAEAVAADLARRLFGDLVPGGSGSGLAGGLLSAFGNLLGLADGGTMREAGISAYSSSVVSRPTLFPFASGIGLMGEAGAEAVLPLKRGRDGKLGVSSGGGHTINVYVNGTSAPDVRRAAGQGAREALGMLNGAQRYA